MIAMSETIQNSGNRAVGSGSMTTRIGLRSLAVAIFAMIAFDLLSFGAWQSWWLASQFLAVTVMLLIQRALQAEAPVRPSAER